MDYQQTLDYLYSALPMYQRVGASAFKKDLSNTQKLCAHLSNPERKFKSIHVAGTNGKGSSSHMLASIFQAAGYKTGLYTSPHLKSFTERLRINGDCINEESVISFVADNQPFLEELKPSFFEMTVAMAFWYFAEEEVDIAIVEVGMGGRLDSTNVIQPEISLITTIGYDHMQFLGDTLGAIAGEKAGIIKPKTSVVISQTQEETAPVFEEKANSENAPISFADSLWDIKKIVEREGLADYRIKHRNRELIFSTDLLGNYQEFNLPGVLETVVQMREKGWNVGIPSVESGLKKVVQSTGLKGRWQILKEKPLTICDTGHNESGFQFILNQISSYDYDDLWMILGFVKDKDLEKVLKLLPKHANFIFSQADLPRALPTKELQTLAQRHQLKGEVIPNVNDALEFASKNAGKDDLIFVGGSTFVIAEIKDL